MPRDPAQPRAVGVPNYKRRAPRDVEAAMTEAELEEWTELRDEAAKLDAIRNRLTARINILRMRASHRMLAAERRAPSAGGAGGCDG